jgi:hypothetical protein
VDTTKKKFVKIIPRIMTVEEAREKATGLNLSPSAIAYIVKEFEYINERIDPGIPDEWLDDVTVLIGDEGRIALGTSWEEGMDELAKAMGYEHDVTNIDAPQADYDRVKAVYDQFFQE